MLGLPVSCQAENLESAPLFIPGCRSLAPV
jgi:hypothetical protein